MACRTRVIRKGDTMIPCEVKIGDVIDRGRLGVWRVRDVILPQNREFAFLSVRRVTTGNLTKGKFVSLEKWNRWAKHARLVKDDK